MGCREQNFLSKDDIVKFICLGLHAPVFHTCLRPSGLHAPVFHKSRPSSRFYHWTSHVFTTGPSHMTPFLFGFFCTTTADARHGGQMQEMSWWTDGRDGASARCGQLTMTQASSTVKRARSGVSVRSIPSPSRHVVWDTNSLTETHHTSCTDGALKETQTTIPLEGCVSSCLR